SPVSVAEGSASTWWTPTGSSGGQERSDRRIDTVELVVGRVVKAHGVSGELVVQVRTDDPDSRFAAGSTLTGKPARGGSAREYAIDSVCEHGGRLLVRLAGVVDRDSADKMRGVVFVVDSEDLPPIDDPDEFYDHQLEGLAVRTVDG